MEIGEQFAMTVAWWMWDDSVMRDAVGVAKLRHAWPVVRKTLQVNASAGRRPASIADLASGWFLSRDPKNLRRVEQGFYKLTDQHLLGLAAALGVAVRDLLPDTASWLASAVAELCPTAVTITEARAFALYRLHHPLDCPLRAQDDLNRQVVLRVQASMDGSFDSEAAISNAVWNTARVLGRVLVTLKGAMA